MNETTRISSPLAPASVAEVQVWPFEDGQLQARWRSEAGLPMPMGLRVVDDQLAADAAWRLLAGGECLLWRGDWVNGRHLLQALARRAERRINRPGKAPATPAAAFAAHRARQGERAGVLARLLVEVGPDYRVPLRRAQSVAEPCREVWGEPDGSASLVSLRELLALVSAHEWRKKGVFVPAAGGRIHPHYGVFSPLRGEYVDLVAQAPLPVAAANCLAFDIGTGSGVLAAVLAQRGVARIVATDMAPRALACAGDNFARLGQTARIELRQADLFPTGEADLVVCNPPWLPAEPTSPVEYAVYDPDSRMLRGFLGGLAAHLRPGGEGWLILSDIAERLELRSREQLSAWIADAGLCIAGRLDTRPQHSKSRDARDPLHAARAGELTSLWRLRRL